MREKIRDDTLNYEMPLHKLFEMQVLLRPEHTALICGKTHLTYRELNERANQLAHLLDLKNVGVGTLVGIALSRNIELVVAILGVLKAGAAYVPLDPTYPKERLEVMLLDCNPTVVITQEEAFLKIPETSIPLICMDTDSELSLQSKENPNVLVNLENLAYVIYTSGSTGTPKGCLTEHRNVTRLWTQSQKLYSFQASDVWTLFHSYAFDFSVWEIWGALIHGGTLVIVPYCVTRSPEDFYKLLVKEKVTILNQTPSAFYQLMHVEKIFLEKTLHLRLIILGGEALNFQALKPWEAHYGLQNPRLINGYGPTETTIFTTFKQITSESLNTPNVSCLGHNIPDLSIHIVDEALNEVTIGEIGEILIGGPGVARGYLNRPELTAQRFIKNPFEDSTHDRLYTTGDLARIMPDGQIEYLGRRDTQVKIRGFRIELGEIENVLRQHPHIFDAVVTLLKDTPDEPYLAAFVIAKNKATFNFYEIHTYLAALLPEYMIPQTFTEIESIPLSPNGKLDYKALPKPFQKRPNLPEPCVEPRTALQRKMAKIWCTLLKMDKVGINDNFFDLGGNSALSAHLVERYKSELQLDLPIVKLFDHPTIHELSKLLSTKKQHHSNKTKKPARIKNENTHKVAIIGMAARYPGSNNIAEFWDNLCKGLETTSFFTNEELDASVSPQTYNHENYVKARGILKGIEDFDASFFKINPYEAEVMDPQQRLFLETAHEALENAGYAPDSYAAEHAGWIGVYGGTYNNSYFYQNVITRPDLIQRAGEFQTMTGSEKDYITTRVSHKLNLKGPSVNVSTACSTSLVAIHMAYHALITHQCNIAIAGGASVSIPQKVGHMYNEGTMLSSDGHTRPFDEKAQGTVFSDGVGIVVLKRFDEAKADGDTIYGVIIGSAINNDGGNKMSFTAPTVEGQSTVITHAQTQAGINPEHISYVEAHGTATPVGDPIEILALTQAFREHTDKKQFCALGSVKGNFGHATIAAGVAGVLKTALALKHKKIPPTVHFEKPNPKIDFANSPFFVNNALIDWPHTHPVRYAGVSSFGVGGTNAHVIIEEALPSSTSSPAHSKELIMLSAKSTSALDVMTENLIKHLKNHPTENLRDVAYTLQTGRTYLTHRRWVIGDNIHDVITNLETLDFKTSATKISENHPPHLVFMFPGQGSQYINMGLNLYQTQKVFHDAFDTCAEFFNAYLEADLRTLIYPKSQDVQNAEILLRETRITQPALFTIEYAIACLWRSLGLEPSAMIGHSIGEFVAATLAEVFSLKDACKLVAIRGKMMQALPKGSMLSVRLSEQDLKEHLNQEIEIASINGPKLCVVAGTTPAIEAFQEKLSALNIVTKLLETSHAFHSAMMEPVIVDFAKVIEEISLSPPTIPFISTVTGTWITDKEAKDIMYWARHLRVPVRFADGMNTLCEDLNTLFLEIGPRTTLTTLARQNIKNPQKQIAISSMTDSALEDKEITAFLKAIGELWQAGVTLDWKAYYQGEHRHRLPLPTYPFERKRFFIERANASPVEGVCRILPTRGVDMNTRKTHLTSMLKEILEETSGIDMGDFDNTTTFFEMGMDSLLLTQVVTALSQKFNVKMTYRQLLEDLGNLDKLAAFLDAELPQEVFNKVSPQPKMMPLEVPTFSQSTPINQTIPLHIENLLNQQLAVMQKQLEILGGGTTHQEVKPVQVSVAPQEVVPETPPKKEKAFGAMARISTTKTDMTLNNTQEKALQNLISSYCKKTALSKKFTEDNREVLADPRIVSGFRPEVKELTYQIHTVKSLGSKLWDVDGNEYVDMTCGFGSNFFGNVPKFIKKAIQDQLDKGMEIGPSLPLAGEVARMICEFTKAERAAFCSTGSEAVLAAMRLARTVTSKKIIVSFTNDYHGLFDEVVVRGSKKLRTTPAAPGIMASCVENILVLEYGSDESLQIIRERANDIAGVLVEPVQSRNPDLQPKVYLQAMRKLTQENNICLIFDEVITGFRVSLGGCQEYFGVLADLATYGKVIGGGLPMGVIAGQKKWMDALDGGSWQFGDDSTPTVGVTYFAGTYVRHPLALAAAKAVLEYLKTVPNIQNELNSKTSELVQELNAWCKEVSAPIHIAHFSSMYRINYTEELPYGDLLFVYMREGGVHIWDQRPCFMTTAHSDKDIALISEVFKHSVLAMQANGFMPGGGLSKKSNTNTNIKNTKEPLMADAKLGRAPNGRPAWYIPDPKNPGKYLMIGEQK